MIDSLNLNVLLNVWFLRTRIDADALPRRLLESTGNHAGLETTFGQKHCFGHGMDTNK